MRVYITKYWQTKGIIEKEVTKSDTNVDIVRTDKWHEIYIRPWWHETLDDAKAHARQQRERKIKALEKQLAKVKKLEF